MPIHDWSRVGAGVFHDFHEAWIINKEIWDTIVCEDFELPADKRLTVAAYATGVPRKAYVEPVAVGDPLPPLPIFLQQGIYVPAPLEKSYEATWDSCPEPMKEYVLGARA